MSSRLGSLWIVIPLTGLAAFVATPAALAADHADAPAAIARPSADLGDAFFFLDPTDLGFVVMAATMRGFIVPGDNANLGYFEPGVVARFEVDNSGDARADRIVEVRFGERTTPTEPQVATIRLPSRARFTAPTTVSNGAAGSAASPQVITTDAESGASFFAGLVDDPFFFDAAAFAAYRQARLANLISPSILTRGRDGFSGYNTLAVVLRVPVGELATGGSTLGLSVSLKARGVKDRVGHPLVNALLIDFANRDAYNAASPAKVAKGRFAEEVAENLRDLQVDDTSISAAELTFVATGDMLRLDLTIPNTGTEGGTNVEAGYPNGRRPNDDVIDHLLTLVNNGVFQGDAVNDNERPISNAFPFFAAPHQPLPPGAGSEDSTRN